MSNIISSAEYKNTTLLKKVNRSYHFEKIGVTNKGDAILYVLVGLTLTGVVPFRLLSCSDPIALGIDKIADLRHWSGVTKLVSSMIKLGALAGLIFLRNCQRWTFDTWVRLAVWLVLGIGIYFVYGRRHSKSQVGTGCKFGPQGRDYLGFGILSIGFIGVIKSTLLLISIFFDHSLTTSQFGTMQISAGLISLLMVGYGFRLMYKNVYVR